jgi:hypothetical protein
MTTMKTGIKALPLSLALSFLALLGACSSVNSTPDSELPTGENSVILENAEEKGAEAVEGLSPDATTGEATDGITEDTATETETTDGITEDTATETEATDGITEDTATETEATDGITEDTATETEATDTETAEEINPTDNPTEIMLPEGDSAEVETDSEAAEGLPEMLPETQPEQ